MIPLSVPNISGNEWEYLKECLDTGWVSSSGKFVDAFENSVKEFTGSKYAIACTNGTSALQLSIRLAGVLAGDEIIVPTLTFIAPVNAVAYNNASPLFMDVDKYYNIDIEKTLEFLSNYTYSKNGFTFNKKTNKRISAIIPVHMWGNAVDLKPLIGVCKDMNIKIIEDASESLGSFYKDKYLKNKHTGTVGDLGCISFNGNKIITTGGGGMILTDNQELAEKAKYLSTQAKDDPVRYIHNDIGYNFRLTNIQSAMGLAQMEQLNSFLRKKKSTYEIYKNSLFKIEGLYIADTPDYSDNNHWMTVMKIKEKLYSKDREEVMNLLRSNSIETRPAWAPIHEQKPYSKYQKYSIDLASKLVSQSLCMPSSTNITDKEITRVINVLYNG